MNINNEFTNTKQLQTKRLILRRFEEDDLSFFYKIFKDEDINKYLPWFPLNSIGEAKTFMFNNYINKYNNDLGFNYAICLKNNNIPIGYLNISLDGSYDLGYGLLKEYWNKGYITEACAELIKHLGQLDIPFITATHDINNIASGVVMQKLGMKYMYTYEEQWMPKDFKVTFRMYQLNLTKEQDYIFTKYWDKSVVKYIENKV